MHSTTLTILASLSLLALAPAGCGLVVDHCIGNCEQVSESDTSTDPAGTTAGSSPTTSTASTDGESDASGGDATTGSEPAVMLGTCDFVDPKPDSHCGDAILQPGDFCFGSAFTTALPLGVYSSLALRLDEDAGADLLLTHDDRTLTTVRMGTGALDPVLAPWAQQFPQPGGVELVGSGDLDEDGIADVVVRVFELNNSSIHALFLDGHGDIASSALIGTFDDWLVMLDVVDWDADGHLDVAVVNAAVMTVLRGDGDGGFVSTPGPSTGDADLWSAMGALDADAVPDDFAFANSNRELRLTRNVAGAEPDVFYVDVLEDKPVIELAIADLDLDGLGDLIALTVNFAHDPATAELVVALQSTGFTPTRYPVQCTYNTMAVGDLDGDGLPDLVTLTGDGRVTARRNDGAGGFVQAVSGLMPILSERLHIADVNGDGANDIVGVAEDKMSVLVNAF